MNSLDREPDISIRIFSEPQLLAPIRALIDSASASIGFCEKSRGLLTLAVDEALANVIRHGYEGRKDGLIWLHLWRLAQPRGIRLVIEDLARKVDLDLIKGRHLDDVRPGGLGVHIIKETMNEATWEHRANGGMRLTLQKLLSPEELQAVGSTSSGSSTP